LARASNISLRELILRKKAEIQDIENRLAAPAPAPVLVYGRGWRPGLTPRSRKALIEKKAHLELVVREFEQSELLQAHASSRDPEARAAIFLHTADYRSIVVGGFAMVFGDPKSRARMILDRVTLASILFSLVSLGAWLGSHFTISEARQHTFLLISAASVWCGARSFSAYKHFAGEFARATWMDFLSHYSTSPSAAPPA
jgi:hypothetical protein